MTVGEGEGGAAWEAPVVVAVQCKGAMEEEEEEEEEEEASLGIRGRQKRAEAGNASVKAERTSQGRCL